jgi:hypothetical protein
VPAKDRELMTQDDNLKFFERGRPEPETDQLQNALKRDVPNGKHGSSSKTAKRASILRGRD